MSRPVSVSISPLILLLLVVLPAGCSNEEPPAPDPELTPGIDLARIGTIGDYPPADSRVVINVDRAGEITVDGMVESLQSLDRLLDARVEGTWEKEGSRASRLSVVLRIDESVPWGAALWLLSMCGDIERRIRCTFFAVMSEVGKEEGALASWLHIREYTHSTRIGPPPARKVQVGIGAKGPAGDPVSLCPLVRSIVDRPREDGEVTPVVGLNARPMVPTGVVLHTIDVLHRSGVAQVDLHSAFMLQQVTSIPDLVRQAATSPPEPAFYIHGRRVEASGEVTLPPVDRVRGGFAGTTEHVDSDFVGPGTFDESPATPEPEGKAEVTRGLQWLADHQDSTGVWDCDGFMKEDLITPICDGAGNPCYDAGVTGLAILAYLGAGYTHKHGQFKKTVREGLKALKRMQDEEGCFGSRETNHFTYNHAIATLAMCEAYRITLSPLFKQSAQRGVDFIEHCRNPESAWRYGVRPGDSDTSVTAWMVLALVSAKSAGLRVDEAALEGAQRWIEEATEPEFGRVGYTSRGTGPARPQAFMDQFPADLSESLTAAGILVRILLGEDPKESGIIRKGADLCLKAPLVWDEESGAIDMSYWFFGTLAMHHLDEPTRDAWMAALDAVVRKHQRTDGAFEGSWDPKGPWGMEGGRVYSTALMLLCLEIHGNHPRVVGRWR